MVRNKTAKAEPGDAVSALTERARLAAEDVRAAPRELRDVVGDRTSAEEEGEATEPEAAYAASRTAGSGRGDAARLRPDPAS